MFGYIHTTELNAVLKMTWLVVCCCFAALVIYLFPYPYAGCSDLVHPCLIHGVSTLCPRHLIWKMSLWIKASAYQGELLQYNRARPSSSKNSSRKSPLFVFRWRLKCALYHLSCHVPAFFFYILQQLNTLWYRRELIMN